MGRPWRPYAKTVFIDTEMDNHIVPEGWDNWRNTANEQTGFYAEYNSAGAGANSKARLKWSRQLTLKERKEYTVQHIFYDWNPEALH